MRFLKKLALIISLLVVIGFFRVELVNASQAETQVGVTILPADSSNSAENPSKNKSAKLPATGEKTNHAVWVGLGLIICGVLIVKLKKGNKLKKIV